MPHCGHNPSFASLDYEREPTQNKGLVPFIFRGGNKCLFLRFFTANSSDLHRQLRTSHEQNGFCARFSFPAEMGKDGLTRAFVTIFPALIRLHLRINSKERPNEEPTEDAGDAGACLGNVCRAGTDNGVRYHFNDPKADHHPKAAVAKKPSVESQIQSLRDDLQNTDPQFKGSSSNLPIAISNYSRRSRQLRPPRPRQRRRSNRLQQQAAADENTQSVNSLQSAVSDLKTNNASLASTLQAIRKK